MCFSDKAPQFGYCRMAGSRPRLSPAEKLLMDHILDVQG